MKRLILTLLTGLIITSSAKAQTDQVTKEMQVYIQAGMKAFADKNFNSSESLAPSLVPSIGGGVMWQRNKFQYGADFSYLDGKKDTDAFGTILTDIQANILAGYRWDLSDRMKLSLQSGFSYSLHHLAVTDNLYSGGTHLNAAIYHNLAISVPVGLWLQRINANGVFTGLRVGYNFPIGTNEWRYMEGSNTEIYTSGADGFNFQLVFGGLLGLNGAK